MLFLLFSLGIIGGGDGGSGPVVPTGDGLTLRRFTRTSTGNP